MSIERLRQQIATRLTAVTARGSFGRSVGLLVGGTMIGRAVPILVLPILTRLYAPADFSTLAVYLGILAIISVAACLRFEIAIPLPEDDAVAASLLALALGSTLAISLMCGLAVFAFPDALVSAMEAPALRNFLWLLPVGVGFAGLYNATQYWATRHRRFRTVAVTRVTQSAAGSAVSLGLGVLGIAPLGLLLGNMMSTSLGFLELGFDASRREAAALRQVTFQGMLSALKTYRRFPLFSTFDALANTAGMQIPIIMIAALSAGPEAGFLMLAMQVMRLPITLLGSAIAQVYLSRAAQEDREGRLPEFTANVVRNLIVLGVGPLLFIGLASPAAFSLIFGEEWRPAGELVLWMTPWFILQFISSPISMVMHVRGRQEVLLFVTIVGGLARIASVIAADHWLFTGIAESYAVASALFYGVLFVACLKISELNVANVVVGRRQLMSAAAGIVFGILVGVALRAI